MILQIKVEKLNFKNFKIQDYFQNLIIYFSRHQPLKKTGK